MSRIKKFNPEILETYVPTILIIGGENQEKSILIAYIQWYMRKRIPMYTSYKKEIISKQKDKLKKCIKDGIEPASCPDLGIGLLLDDCQEEGAGLLMNGRNWQISYIVSLQYTTETMKILPNLITNVDFVFCFRDNIVENQKNIYSNFFGCFKKFSHFQEVFNIYECLVLDNTSKSTKVEDYVFYFNLSL